MPSSKNTAEQLPRGRHGLTPDAVADAQRERLLRGMIAAVAERGYGETRVVDAIEHAGVSRKTFYELYADKEDCFLAAFDLVFARLYELSSAAYEADPDAAWIERVRAGLAALLEALAADPDQARFAIVEVLAAGPRALARRDAAIREFTQFVDAGRSESRLELPGITSVAIVGGIYELIYTEVLHEALAHLPERLPDLVYWVAQPYLGVERAAEERELTRASARKAGGGAKRRGG